MGRLSDQLANHALIGVDTAIFIYHIESHPLYSRLTTELLDGVESGQWFAITSVITVMELTVHPWRVNRPNVARQYEAFLVHFPNLTLADVTRDVARRAAQARALYRLRPADAIQIATVLTHGATAFVTNDRDLTRLSADIEVVILDNFVP